MIEGLGNRIPEKTTEACPTQSPLRWEITTKQFRERGSARPMALWTTGSLVYLRLPPADLFLGNHSVTSAYMEICEASFAKPNPVASPWRGRSILSRILRRKLPSDSVSPTCWQPTATRLLLTAVFRPSVLGSFPTGPERCPSCEGKSTYQLLGSTSIHNCTTHPFGTYSSPETFSKFPHRWLIRFPTGPSTDRTYALEGRTQVRANRFSDDRRLRLIKPDRCLHSV